MEPVDDVVNTWTHMEVVHVFEKVVYDFLRWIPPLLYIEIVLSFEERVRKKVNCEPLPNLLPDFLVHSHSHSHSLVLLLVPLMVCYVLDPVVLLLPHLEYPHISIHFFKSFISYSSHLNFFKNTFRCIIRCG